MQVNKNLSSFAAQRNSSLLSANTSLTMQLPLRAYGKGASPVAQADFSEKALVIAVAAVAVDAAPETRDDLVARLAPQINSGHYQVNSTAIASRMIAQA